MSFSRKSKIPQPKIKFQKKGTVYRNRSEVFFRGEHFFEESSMKITNCVCPDKYSDDTGNIFGRAVVVPGSLYNRYFRNNCCICGRDERAGEPVVDIRAA